jgi:hypothetical protein
LLDTHRFEIGAGEVRTFTFKPVIYKSERQTLVAVVGQKAVSHEINILKAPAKLALSNVKTTIDETGVLHYQARAGNRGSVPYKKNFQIIINGKVAINEPLEISPGTSRKLELNYALQHSGIFSIKIGDAAEQQMTVPGGVTLALQEPLIYLNFDAADRAGVKDAISGTVLPIQGIPRFVPGRSGQAFQTEDKNTFIKAGGIDLYRKSFTLAAWVNIESLENGQAMFFGGQAPMGADVDTTGTGLAAGVLGETPLLSFWDRDVRGRGKISSEDWIHFAYTYDADAELGSVYINGKLDKTQSQKTYAGPLDMIGGALRFNHGKYAMDDVLVSRNCLGAPAIQELADKGVDALKNGQIITEWRTISSFPTTLETWTEIPAGSSIMVTIESADTSGNIVFTRSVELKSGNQKISLTDLKAGTQTRLRIQLAENKWGSVPVMQTAVLSGKEQALRWSTTKDWQKGTVSNGLKIGD